MSKRNYRRLAVVAGAALAAGSMAPAMAAIHVAGAGTGAAAVDVSGVNIPTTDSLIPTDLVGEAHDFALGQVSAAQMLVGEQVQGLQVDVSNIAGSLLDAATGLSVNLRAVGGAQASTGGAAVQVSGLGLVDGTDGIDGVLGNLPAPGDILGGAQETVGSVAGYGVATALGAAGLAQDAVGAGSGLLDSGLNLIDTATLRVNASAVAGLVGSL